MKKLFLTLLPILALLVGCSNNNATSISVIGGADGPTSIFITSNPIYFFLAILALLIVVLIVYFIKKRK